MRSVVAAAVNTWFSVWLSLSMTGLGVFAGAKTMNQVSNE
ncbi:Uncharacterised protein [Mycobacteroides abscessus subsp. abscessus]|nr:Uncharacterised protein [Mycobacteroides abscessus subsp. abscessus]